MYMPGTKFEMRYYDGPQDMLRVAMQALGIGITWTENEKNQDDPDYQETFEILDTRYPQNNAKGLSRQECERRIHDLHMEELCR